MEWIPILKKLLLIDIIITFVVILIIIIAVTTVDLVGIVTTIIITIMIIIAMITIIPTTNAHIDQELPIYFFVWTTMEIKLHNFFVESLPPRLIVVTCWKVQL